MARASSREFTHSNGAWHHIATGPSERVSRGKAVETLAPTGSPQSQLRTAQSSNSRAVTYRCQVPLYRAFSFGTGGWGNSAGAWLLDRQGLPHPPGSPAGGNQVAVCGCKVIETPVPRVRPARTPEWKHVPWRGCPQFGHMHPITCGIRNALESGGQLDRRNMPPISRSIPGFSFSFSRQRYTPNRFHRSRFLIVSIPSDAREFVYDYYL